MKLATAVYVVVFSLIIVSFAAGYGTANNFWLGSSEPDTPIVEPVLLPKAVAEVIKPPPQPDDQESTSAQRVAELVAWREASVERMAESRRRADSLHGELAEPTAPWLERYGTGDESKLYYNVVMQRAVLNQHAKVINNLRSTTQPTSQPVEKP